MLRGAVVVVTLAACGRIGFDANSDGTSVDGTSGTASLTGTLTVGPWGANLTTEGTRDWIHWGFTTEGAVNRKIGGGSLIGTYEHLNAGAVSRQVSAGSTLSWTDGTPAMTATNTPDCQIIDTDNVSGDAFRISVAADQDETLSIYIGNWCVRTRLEAAFDDDSARTAVDTSWELQVPQGQTGTYVVDIHPASPGRTVIFTFTVDQNFCTTGDVGELWLAGAALRPGD